MSQCPQDAIAINDAPDPPSPRCSSTASCVPGMCAQIDRAQARAAAAGAAARWRRSRSAANDRQCRQCRPRPRRGTAAPRASSAALPRSSPARPAGRRTHGRNSPTTAGTRSSCSIGIRLRWKCSVSIMIPTLSRPQLVTTSSAPSRVFHSVELTNSRLTVSPSGLATSHRRAKRSITWWRSRIQTLDSTCLAPSSAAVSSAGR